MTMNVRQLEGHCHEMSYHRVLARRDGLREDRWEFLPLARRCNLPEEYVHIWKKHRRGPDVVQFP